MGKTFAGQNGNQMGKTGKYDPQRPLNLWRAASVHREAWVGAPELYIGSPELFTAGYEYGIGGPEDRIAFGSEDLKKHQNNVYPVHWIFIDSRMSKKQVNPMGNLVFSKRENTS